MRALRIALLLTVALAARPALAFCGCMVRRRPPPSPEALVASAGSEIFNQSSQVALVRNGTHTVLTMSSDFKGAFSDFALVVPVPSLLEREQIHVGDQRLISRIDAWSGPKVIERRDPNPCVMGRGFYDGAPRAMAKSAHSGVGFASSPQDAAAFGVQIEAQYTVGEYDLAILSAEQSKGLAAYLDQQGYQLPPKAASALAPYVRQGMKFLVAKVNLGAQASTGYQTLRPLQMAFDSEKFMLPIRLGMANADGPQDLIVYAVTPQGRVESANYHTVKMPTELDVPVFVETSFRSVYQAIFDRAYERENHRGVFTEYAWGNRMVSAQPPLSAQELHDLGAYWMGSDPLATAFVTRLHVRYDSESFPEDLVFQNTGDGTGFQTRYIVNQPFSGDLSCPGGQQYLAQLASRRTEEAQNLVRLTGWSDELVAGRMGRGGPTSVESGPRFAQPPPPLPSPQPGPPPPPVEPELPWYKRIWQ